MFARTLGDAGDDADNALAVVAGSDPYLNAIRAISVPMGLLRKRINAELNKVSNADAEVDVDQVIADLQQMNLYVQQLPTAIAAFKASPAYQADAATARELDNWLAFTMDWAGSTLQAVGQLPAQAATWAAGQLQAILDAVGNAANTAAWNVVKAVAPILIVGVGLMFLLESKSRTYRKVVA